jgi:short-subunit dehydrogenase
MLRWRHPGSIARLPVRLPPVQISGSNALVTGATGGIGHAIARELHSQGARLVLTGRRTDTLRDLATELDARELPADLSDADDVDRLAEQAGAIDILIANAALPASGRLETYTPEQIGRAVQVNLLAPIALAHALTPAMAERRRGHLVFISSLAGKAATAGAPLYNATKHGLRGFASSLRIDLRASGVGVSTVFPGFIREAGMYADANVTLPRGVGTRSPQDVARAVVRAIVENRGEIDVAPPALRLGTALAGLAPELAAAASRRMGAEEIALEYERAQREMR